MTLQEWLEGFGRAWRERDGDVVAALFTQDAVYRSSPFEEPAVGRAAIRDFWRQATAAHEDVDVRFGEPVAAGRRVVVEWWATLRDGGRRVTLPGSLVLSFAADGRCEEVREYWHVEEGEHEPHPGWGL